MSPWFLYKTMLQKSKKPISFAPDSPPPPPPAHPDTPAEFSVNDTSAFKGSFRSCSLPQVIPPSVTTPPCGGSWRPFKQSLLIGNSFRGL